MKILFTGSRGITSQAVFDKCISQIFVLKDDSHGRRWTYKGQKIEMIIQGGANGVDKMAKSWADAEGIATQTVRPDYDKYGPKYAPLQRNAVMVDSLVSGDIVVSIYDGKSSGTKYTMDMAKRKRRKVIEFNWDREKGWVIVERTPMAIKQYSLDL